MIEPVKTPGEIRAEKVRRIEEIEQHFAPSLLFSADHLRQMRETRDALLAEVQRSERTVEVSPCSAS